MDEREEHQLRAARTQSLYREVNEQIERVHVQLGPGGHEYDVICECADDGCSLRLRMTAAEYARVRSSPERFVVVPGHVLPEVEHVVERTDAYEVVEKIGAGARLARRTDPRAAS